MERVKKTAFLLIILILIILISRCTLLKKPVDNKTGFSQSLVMLEKAISEENYDIADGILIDSMGRWKKVKPFMQVEIDHDVVNEIESELVALTAYLEAKDKSSALASIRVVINMWTDIGSK